MKRRLVSILLMAVVLLHATIMASAAGSIQNFKIQNNIQNNDTTDLFRDVPTDAWYHDSVRQAYELGLVKGVGEGKFDPTGSITLAETIALACRIHSMYYGGTGEFTQGDPWFQVYLDYALENGMIEEQTSEPDYTVVADRESFAKILAASLPKTALKKINDIDIQDLPDYLSIGKEGQEAVERLYRAGVLTGSDRRGTFNPASSIQRCEVATIVTRMVMPELRKSFEIDKNPERITLTKTELYVDRTMTFYVPWEGDEDVYIVCEYDSSMVDVEWKEGMRKGAPLVITPLRNGQTMLTIYLEEAPEERHEVLLTISMAD